MINARPIKLANLAKRQVPRFETLSTPPNFKWWSVCGCVLARPDACKHLPLEPITGAETAIAAQDRLDSATSHPLTCSSITADAVRYLLPLGPTDYRCAARGCRFLGEDRNFPSIRQSVFPSFAKPSGFFF